MVPREVRTAKSRHTRNVNRDAQTISTLQYMLQKSEGEVALMKDELARLKTRHEQYTERQAAAARFRKTVRRTLLGDETAMKEFDKFLETGEI
ncbi:hypothetical protein BKA93DRAFT_802819, partial [Sparassis latifolia]